jgi:lipopolysaccharide export LptBFGC system permease protein LptF
MAATDLLQYIEHLRSNRQQTARYGRRSDPSVHPFSVVLMMVLALPFRRSGQQCGRESLHRQRDVLPDGTVFRALGT